MYSSVIHAKPACWKLQLHGELNIKEFPRTCLTKFRQPYWVHFTKTGAKTVFPLFHHFVSICPLWSNYIETNNVYGSVIETVAIQLGYWRHLVVCWSERAWKWHWVHHMNDICGVLELRIAFWMRHSSHSAINNNATGISRRE